LRRATASIRLYAEVPNSYQKVDPIKIQREWGSRVVGGSGVSDLW
jgi:hypothetical protein